MKSQLKITVDLGDAFDRLSILYLKMLKKPNSRELAKQGQRLLKEIVEGITAEKAKKILASKEYKNLLEKNEIVFDEMDKLNQEGHAIDKLNYDRFLAKRALQNKFAKKNLTEVKIRENETKQRTSIKSSR